MRQEGGEDEQLFPSFLTYSIGISGIFSNQYHFLIKHTTQGLEHDEDSINIGTDDIDGGGRALTSEFPVMLSLGYATKHIIPQSSGS